jgi:hypothetical protein
MSAGNGGPGTGPTAWWQRRDGLRDGVLVWAAVTLIGGVAIRSCVSLDVQEAPAAEDVARAMAALRAAAAGEAAVELGEAAQDPLPGPSRVVLWAAGLPAFRQEFDVPTLGGLVQQAGRALAEARAAGKLENIDLAQARFHLSFIVAEGPILSWPTLAASASFVTTLDGAALRLKDRTVRLYPDDLLRRKLYSAFLPLPGGQMKAGLDVPAVVESLWLSAHLADESWEEQKPALRRFRTADFVERPGALPEVLLAGRVINPLPRTVDDLRNVALGGVRWLAQAIQPNGKFQYDYDPTTDGPFDPGYSLPRHSGAAYFLSFAYRKTGDAAARDTARSALDYVVEREMRPCGKAPGRCVGMGGMVDAGSAALTVVAMAEYERGTQEGRFLEPMKQVLEFLRWLQEPNGDFVHLYDTGRDVRVPERLLYYSGEATLALIEAYRVLKDPALLDPIRAALDFLTKENWSFFGSAYFFGEEHWTCIAANEAFPEVQDDAYLEFCERFAGFLRQLQTEEGEPPFGFEGAYVVTPFLAPRTTPVAGRTEATVATYKLGEAMGRPNLVVLEQVRRSLTFLARMRYTPDSSPFFLHPERAAGGMPGGFDDPVIRIDYVQHAGNALLGGADILGNYELTPP